MIEVHIDTENKKRRIVLKTGNQSVFLTVAEARRLEIKLQNAQIEVEKDTLEFKRGGRSEKS